MTDENDDECLPCTQRIVNGPGATITTLIELETRPIEEVRAHLCSFHKEWMQNAKDRRKFRDNRPVRPVEKD
jgi:hypothetical protein